MAAFVTHSIVAIAAAIRRTLCYHILRHVEFSTNTFCEIVDTLVSRLREKGEHGGSQASLWQRQMAQTLEGHLKGYLGGPWD